MHQMFIEHQLWKDEYDKILFLRDFVFCVNLFLMERLHEVTMMSVYGIQSSKSHKKYTARLRFLVFFWPDLGALQIDYLLFMKIWEVQ